jgi:hypothetical protein
VKLVQLKRQGNDGNAEVVAAIGPMSDDEADAYASRLMHAVEQHPNPGLSVATTPVQSTSGEAVGSPADPAELLQAVLSRGDGAGDGDGDHDLPEPDARE